ncbi:MAG TPA: sulfur carrier protein ThiS [Candidatus Pelagibacter bacterium]|jgi:sulfur carrier protein|nr:thiamine biosynthesis protein ThiS [Pelagibacteraceae bacterium]HJN84171.1 sulfur carrier protein ThiS [Candidatus Pelagibacter bacterium]|tara:strand:- start:4850 stop:5068 length:219 start_codon:yes stop_codon:yes gene_type:complete
MKKINKIKIKLNGKYIKIQDKITLLNLTKKFRVPVKKVAIELNQTIVNKKSLNKIKIKKNDKIEIVHFIGGG